MSPWRECACIQTYCHGVFGIEGKGRQENSAAGAKVLFFRVAVMGFKPKIGRAVQKEKSVFPGQSKSTLRQIHHPVMCDSISIFYEVAKNASLKKRVRKWIDGGIVPFAS